MNSTGKAARLARFGSHGGPRAILRARHGGAYQRRPGIYADRKPGRPRQEG
jgi:hypothetical protein